MDIAFFGGTFDPPHYGHFAVCTLIREILSPDKIILSPSKNPLKPNQESSDNHSLKMLRILSDDLNQTGKSFEVSDWELCQNGPSFTVDTIRHFQKIYPNSRIFLCIGQDNYAIFPKWKGYQTILNLCHIVVFARPGSHTSSVDAPFNPNKFTWIDLDLPLSSTECRNAIASKEPSCLNQLPTKIAGYIRQHRLYGF